MPAQAGAYFAAAKTITAAEQHDYSWAPCYVRGTGQMSGHPITWEIQAGGLGRVTSEDGSVVLLADEAQKEEQQ